MYYVVITPDHIILAKYKTKASAMKRAKLYGYATIGLCRDDGYILQMWKQNGKELFWSFHYSDWRNKDDTI